MLYLVIYDKIHKKETKEYYHSYYFFKKRYNEIKRSKFLEILEMSNLYD